MGIRQNSDEAFALLVTEAEESWTLSLMAFALLEQQRVEWVDQFRSVHGREPSVEETTGWYAGRTPGDYLRVKGEAENTLSLFVEQTVEEAISEAESLWKRDAIFSHIKMYNGFFRQAGTNIVGGVIAAFVFSFVVLYQPAMILTPSGDSQASESLNLWRP